MECPMCGSDTRVKRTVQVAGGLQRDRVCTGPAQHRHQTVEGYVGWRLEDVYVRRSADRKIAAAFDRAKLRVDLIDNTLDRIPGGQLENVLAEVVISLRTRVAAREGVELVTHRPSPDLPVQRVPALWDWAIVEAVEAALWRNGHHIARVLYALRFRVRSDRRHKGWLRAEDVLEWLYSDDAYPDLRSDTSIRPSVYTAEWVPQMHETTPVSVVKRTARDGHGRRTEPFDYKKFTSSLNKAFLGRPGAARTAEFVSWYVLRPLHGQQSISSAQLGIGVLNCLRQTDDIAYLRWATIMKNLGTGQCLPCGTLRTCSAPIPTTEVR